MKDVMCAFAVIMTAIVGVTICCGFQQRYKTGGSSENTVETNLINVDGHQYVVATMCHDGGQGCGISIVHHEGCRKCHNR